MSARPDASLQAEPSPPDEEASSGVDDEVVGGEAAYREGSSPANLPTLLGSRPPLPSRVSIISIQRDHVALLMARRREGRLLPTSYEVEELGAALTGRREEDETPGPLQRRLADREPAILRALGEVLDRAPSDVRNPGLVIEDDLVTPMVVSCPDVGSRRRRILLVREVRRRSHLPVAQVFATFEPLAEEPGGDRVWLAGVTARDAVDRHLDILSRFDCTPAWITSAHLVFLRLVRTGGWVDERTTAVLHGLQGELSVDLYHRGVPTLVRRLHLDAVEKTGSDLAEFVTDQVRRTFAYHRKEHRGDRVERILYLEDGGLAPSLVDAIDDRTGASVHPILPEDFLRLDLRVSVSDRFGEYETDRFWAAALAADAAGDPEEAVDLRPDDFRYRRRRRRASWAVLAAGVVLLALVGAVALWIESRRGALEEELEAVEARIEETADHRAEYRRLVEHQRTVEEQGSLLTELAGDPRVVPVLRAIAGSVPDHVFLDSVQLREGPEAEDGAPTWDLRMEGRIYGPFRQNLQTVARLDRTLEELPGLRHGEMSPVPPPGEVDRSRPILTPFTYVGSVAPPPTPREADDHAEGEDER